MRGWWLICTLHPLLPLVRAVPLPHALGPLNADDVLAAFAFASAFVFALLPPCFQHKFVQGHDRGGNAAGGAGGAGAGEDGLPGGAGGAPARRTRRAPHGAPPLRPSRPALPRPGEVAPSPSVLPTGCCWPCRRGPHAAPGTPGRSRAAGAPGGPGCPEDGGPRPAPPRPPRRPSGGVALWEGGRHAPPPRGRRAGRGGARDGPGRGPACRAPHWAEAVAGVVPPPPDHSVAPEGGTAFPSARGPPSLLVEGGQRRQGEDAPGGVTRWLTP